MGPKGQETVYYRDAGSRLFSCNVCKTYQTQDPELIRKHILACQPSSEECSLPNISNNDYYRLPDENTITSIPGYNLLSFNIVVNTLLKAIICIHCQHPVLPPSRLPQHVHAHISAIVVPTTLVENLVQQFQLEENLHYPTEVISPVYGIPLLEEPHFFCQKCNQGYQSLSFLRSHQSRHRCTGHTLGYGQLIPGHNRRIIQVFLDKLVFRKDLDLDYPSLFKQGSSSPDYSNNPIPIVENESNLSAFFRQDGWLNHVQGNSPSDLHEARRTHEKDDTVGDAIRQASRRYLVHIQSQIEENIHYGLLRNIATTNV